MEFSRQEYWSGLPFPSPGYLPDPGIEPGSPTLQADALLSEPLGKSILKDDGVLKLSAQMIAFCGEYGNVSMSGEEPALTCGEEHVNRWGRGEELVKFSVTLIVSPKL